MVDQRVQRETLYILAFCISSHASFFRGGARIQSNHITFIMVKVTVCGAAGGIGQPLSLLLKLNENVIALSLYDIANVRGVAADLNHVNTQSTVEGYQPDGKDDSQALKTALNGSQIVVIPAGVPRKPGMTRDDLFKVNAGIVRGLVNGVAKYCPEAVVCIISNPVNSTVPIAAAELKKNGVFDPSRLFGVTTLDSVRAEKFLSEMLKDDPRKIKGHLCVVGGHSGKSIVPLLHVNAKLSERLELLSEQDIQNFIHRVQFGGDEVVKAKDGKGSATLSMAYAGYRFVEFVISSMVGNSVAKDEGVYPESAFVFLPGIEGGDAIAQKVGSDFFSVPVVLGKGGAAVAVLDPLNNLTAKEQKLVSIASQNLSGEIAKGVNFVVGPKL